MEVKFEMGQVDKHMESKAGKGGPKKCGGKGKYKLKPSNGPTEGIKGPYTETKRAQQEEAGLGFVPGHLFRVG